LKLASNWWDCPRQDVSWARRSDNLEGNRAIVGAHNGERLLTLLGMDGQRAVGEPEPVGLVNDVDDPTHDLDPPDGQLCRHRDDSIDRWWTSSLYDEAGPLVYAPVVKRFDGTVEHLPALAERS
jgi:hypothetical protein